MICLNLVSWATIYLLVGYSFAFGGDSDGFKGISFLVKKCPDKYIELNLYILCNKQTSMTISLPRPQALGNKTRIMYYVYVTYLVAA